MIHCEQKNNLHPNKQSAGFRPSNKISRAQTQKKRCVCYTSEGRYSFAYTKKVTLTKGGQSYTVETNTGGQRSPA